MKSKANRAQEAEGTTPNQWGGSDYRGKAGLARTTVEDGLTTVYYFTRSGQADLMAWEARFSSATPVAVSNAAIEAAKRLADGRGKR